VTVTGEKDAAKEAAAQGPLLDVVDLKVDFHRGGQTSRPWRGSPSPSSGVRRSASWASPGAASPPRRAIVQVERPTGGSVSFKGTDPDRLDRRSLRSARTGIQMIFQDPISSLNPRRRVRDIVAEPLDIWKRGSKGERAQIVREMLTAVGSTPTWRERYPREFSGGQCQRISIAEPSCSSPSCSCATRWSRPSTSRCRPRS